MVVGPESLKLTKLGEDDDIEAFLSTFKRAVESHNIQRVTNEQRFWLQARFGSPAHRKDTFGICCYEREGCKELLTG